jgi:hypothetical protein
VQGCKNPHGGMATGRLAPNRQQQTAASAKAGVGDEDRTRNPLFRRHTPHFRTRLSLFFLSDRSILPIVLPGPALGLPVARCGMAARWPWATTPARSATATTPPLSTNIAGTSP